MLFDFERFKPRIKLAYRNCPNCPYSIEEVTAVIAYYFDTYEYIFDNPHPVISLQQLTDIICKMPEVNGLYIEPENTEDVIIISIISFRGLSEKIDFTKRVIEEVKQWQLGLLESFTAAMKGIAI